MTRPAPKTAAEARKLISDLEAKRTTLTNTIQSSAERRSAAAVAAELGDEAAKETLRKITVEATEATDALQNIEAVISSMKLLRDELASDEATAREIEKAAAGDAAVDELFAIEDELDDDFENIRAKLAKREELARNPNLRLAKVSNPRGLPIVSDRELGQTILGYLDKELHFVSGGVQASYSEITRFSDWSSRRYGRKSPGQIKRGPRPLSQFERTLKQAFDRPAPMQGNGGFDSTVEAAKRRSIDVSGGMMRNAR